MRLNLKHIIDFICERWKLSRRTIATDYLNCNHAKFSKNFYEDQETLNKMYSVFFDLNNENSVASKQGEDEPELLKVIKKFMEQYKFDLKDIWDCADYEVFVRGLLQKANEKPGKDESIPYSDELSERMIVIFIKAIISCDVYLLVNHPNIDSKSKLNKFVEIIKTEIEIEFEQHKEERTYDKIMEFTRLLEHYADSLTHNDYNEASYKFSEYSSGRASSDRDYLRLGKLYRGLTGGRLFPIMNASLISEGCDEELREIFLSGIPDDEQSNNSIS